MRATQSKFVQALTASALISDQMADVSVQAALADGLTDKQRAAKLVESRKITSFQAELLLAGNYRQLKVDRYLLTERIGQGGMGSIYAARDCETQQMVAIKLLAPHLKHDAGMRTRFRLEAEAGEGLPPSPHVVRTLRHGITDDVFGEVDYMVMEYFRGIALNELVAFHGPLIWSTACDFIAQAAAGLHDLHVAGFVHRDVKPDNLLVDTQGHVKLVDLGLALIDTVDQASDSIELGDEFSLAMLFGHDCIGTVDYMAPEQAENSLRAEARVDVYGLGCTFYTLLTGQRPYRGGSRQEIRDAHRKTPVPQVSDRVANIPAEVDALVASMMAKRPADRPESMDDVVLSLVPMSVHQPIRFKYEDLLRARRRYYEQRAAGSCWSTATARSDASPRPISSLSASPSNSSSSSTTNLAPTSQQPVSPETAVQKTETPAKSSPVAMQPTHVASETEVKRTNVTGVGSNVASPSEPLTLQIQNDTTAAAVAAQLIDTYSANHLERCEANERDNDDAKLELPDGVYLRLPLTSISIGRQSKNDIVFNLSELSSRHCSLLPIGDRWMVRDEGSKNGLFVNGKRVREMLLNDGDEVRLARTVRLRFHQPGLTRQAQHARRRTRIAISVASIALLSLIAYLAITLFR